MNSGSNRAYNSPNSSYSSNQINTSMRPNQLQNKFITSPQQSGINFQAVSQKMPVSNSLPSQVAPVSIGSKQVVSPLNLPRNDVGMVPRSSESYSQQLPSPSSNVITSSQVQQFNQVFKQEASPTVGTNKVDPFVSNLGQGFSQLPPKSPMPMEPINSLPSTSQPFILPQGIISPLDSLPKPTSQSSYNNSFPLPSSQLPTYSMGSSSRPPYAVQAVAQSPNRNSQEEPLSSGPPRTNVLGIIPYSSVCILFSYLLGDNFIFNNLKLFNFRRLLEQCPNHQWESLKLLHRSLWVTKYFKLDSQLEDIPLVLMKDILQLMLINQIGYCLKEVQVDHLQLVQITLEYHLILNISIQQCPKCHIILISIATHQLTAILPRKWDRHIQILLFLRLVIIIFYNIYNFHCLLFVFLTLETSIS
jgi:hypothetical protein